MDSNQGSPYFSIIVPIYNVEKYLPRCVESLLKQTYTDFEAILVDDGSGDSSSAICDQFAESDVRIKVIHKENGGLVSARKAGIQTAKGRYVLNVDGDDSLAPELLQKINEVAEKYAPDVIAFQYVEKRENGDERVCGSSLEEGMYTGSKLREISSRLVCDRKKGTLNVGCIMPSICMKAVNRELLLSKQLEVPVQLANGEDMAVTIPVICACSSLYELKFNGYYYYQYDSSMIHSFRPDEIKKNVALVEFLGRHTANVPPENLKSYFYYLYFQYVVQAARFYTKFKDFHQSFKANLPRDAIAMLKQCSPWLTSKKDRIYFFLIRHQLLFPIWIYYNKLKPKQKIIKKEEI